MNTLEIALQYLGTRGDQAQLRCDLEEAEIKFGELTRIASNPYPVELGDTGIILMMQHLTLRTGALGTDAVASWEVQSVHIEKGAWQSRWLVDVSSEGLTAQHVFDLLAKDKERGMAVRDVACFTMDGDRGQTWSVVALCDRSGLKSMTISVVQAVKMPAFDLAQR